LFIRDSKVFADLFARGGVLGAGQPDKDCSRKWIGWSTRLTYRSEHSKN